MGKKQHEMEDNVMKHIHELWDKKKRVPSTLVFRHKCKKNLGSKAGYRPNHTCITLKYCFTKALLDEIIFHTVVSQEHLVSYHLTGERNALT